MKILIIGSGGREHALAWKLKQSPKISKIYCAPGNGGTATLTENIDIKAEDLTGLLAFAQKNSIDLTVVGPEVPLTLGIVDLFEKNGLKIFGPCKAAAQVEGSKLFSKNIMQKYKIPSAGFASFTDPVLAKVHLKSISYPTVIKADGLAAGKGVVIAQNQAEAEKAIDDSLTAKVFGSAGSLIVIEDFLVGEEASLLAFTDGKTVLPMASAQDHKAIYDGDKGPNTGGMGAYSPAPVLDDKAIAEVQKLVLEPMVKGLLAEGIKYKGVLYAGLMMTKDGPKVVEFNARFGDPETQVILPRMENDLVEVMLAIIEEKLDQVELRWKKAHCISVVLAAGGYPGSYQKGQEITGLEGLKDSFAFHAGTVMDQGVLRTSGGRVINLTALGPTLKTARDTVYAEIDKLKFTGVYFRKDIGWKALASLDRK
ncbi:MAG: phosphoribosylamine--glycine ligase [Candidatus Margulisiibacteriota bacterium]|jgi:phosphoribosylamine--glycine ligase